MFSQEERQLIQRQQRQIQELTKQQALADSVTFKRTENLIDLEKEAGIAAVHGRKYAPDKRPDQKGGRNGARSSNSK